MVLPPRRRSPGADGRNDQLCGDAARGTADDEHDREDPVVLHGFGWLGWDSWKDLQAFPEKPARLDLAAAAVQSSQSDHWVTIDDARWLCNQTLHDAGRETTYILITDPSGSQLVVAIFNQELPCEAVADRPVTGVLGPMRSRTLDRLTQAGLDVSGLPTDSKVMRLCTYCGKDNSQTGVILGAIFVLVGLSMYPLSLAVQRWGLLGHMR
jgi:hypothetical protein